MDNQQPSPHRGRGSPAKDLLQSIQSLSHMSRCPPAPSLNAAGSLLSNVASGRAAQVVLNLKKSTQPSSSLHVPSDLNLTSSTMSDNQLFVSCAVCPWYKYTIEFEPDIPSRTTRFTMINHLSPYLGGAQRLYDGQHLYVPHQLTKEHLAFNNTSSNGPSEVHIRFVDTIDIDRIPIDLINNLFRSAIQQGREWLETKTNRPGGGGGFRQKARYWHGKIMGMQRQENGLLLTIDFEQKQTNTCYEELERLYMTADSDYQDVARRELINKLVLTRYDNRTQRIDNIDFNLTPATYTFVDDPQTTLIDYYLNKFDIAIDDPDQPLLVYCPRRPGESLGNIEANYLVPELCQLTGLSDRAHRDARVRKTNTFITLDSIARKSEMAYFDDSLRRNAATVKYLALWGINVVSNIPKSHSPRSLTTDQKVAAQNDGTGEEDEENEGEDTQDNDNSYGHFTNPINLTNWLLVYPKVDEERANIYINMLRQVGQQQGMTINEPVHIQIEDENTETFAHALRSNLNENIQLVSVIVKSRRIDRYNAIKRICCIEIPTPTEIVLRNTIADDEILPGVALNIARDINFKLGGEIRPINLSMSNTMILSLATWTSTSVNYQSDDHLAYVLAIVASLNSSMTEYFSHAKSYTSEKDLRADIGLFVRSAVFAYNEQNQMYPTTIIIGRDVFSSFDDLNSIKENEIPAIIHAITDSSQTMIDYQPRLIVFTMMKQMIYDFYNYVQPIKVANIDCMIADQSPSYYFYLSSHRERCSTLQARQFLVLFDNTDLSAHRVQRLILQLSLHAPQRNQFFLPSICRFARRLASLVGETLGDPPRIGQRQTLFYL